jgi:hypothetical protein
VTVPGRGARVHQGRLIALESVLAGVVVALLCGAYLWFARYGFDLMDEGYFMSHARRVELGALPYRDFSTPYTPGVFYLYAGAMHGFGADVVGLRWLHVAARAVVALGLYAAGRQLMPPLFAAVPPALIMAMDRVPELWSLHPGWYTAAATVLAVLAVARYVQDGRGGWLLAAGVASGVGFAFKQNLAAFGLMAALWLLVVAERELPPPAAPGGRAGGALPGGGPGPAVAVMAATRLAIQVAALVLLPVMAAMLIRAHWSELMLAIFVLPLAAVSGVAAARLALHGADRAGTTLRREVLFYARPLLVLAGFGAVTVPWLALLVAALDGRLELLGSFVGDVDTAGYFRPILPLRPAHLAIVVATLVAPLLVPSAACAADGDAVSQRWGCAPWAH